MYVPHHCLLVNGQLPPVETLPLKSLRVLAIDVYLTDESWCFAQEHYSILPMCHHVSEQSSSHTRVTSLRHSHFPSGSQCHAPAVPLPKNKVDFRQKCYACRNKLKTVSKQSGQDFLQMCSEASANLHTLFNDIASVLSNLSPEAAVDNIAGGGSSLATAKSTLACAAGTHSSDDAMFETCKARRESRKVPTTCAENPIATRTSDAGASTHSGSQEKLMRLDVEDVMFETRKATGKGIERIEPEQVSSATGDCDDLLFETRKGPATKAAASKPAASRLADLAEVDREDMMFETRKGPTKSSGKACSNACGDRTTEDMMFETCRPPGGPGLVKQLQTPRLGGFTEDEDDMMFETCAGPSRATSAKIQQSQQSLAKSPNSSDHAMFQARKANRSQAQASHSDDEDGEEDMMFETCKPPTKPDSEDDMMFATLGAVPKKASSNHNALDNDAMFETCKAPSRSRTSTAVGKVDAGGEVWRQFGDW